MHSTFAIFVIGYRINTMEYYKFNTYKFIRRYYNIPVRVRLQWCIVRERTKDGVEFRLGVALVGTNKYIDVAMRRFFSCVKCRAVERSYELAERHLEGDMYVYRAMDILLSISKPVTYISDIYFPTWYDKDMAGETLL